MEWSGKQDGDEAGEPCCDFSDKTNLQMWTYSYLKAQKPNTTDSKFHPPTLLLFFIKLSCSPCWMCSCWWLSWKPLVSGSSSQSRLWSVMTSWPICLGSSLEELHWSRWVGCIMYQIWMRWCEITALISFHLSFFSLLILLQLSPKKTWEGFIGGFFSTVVFGFMVRRPQTVLIHMVVDFSSMRQQDWCLSKGLTREVYRYKINTSELLKPEFPRCLWWGRLGQVPTCWQLSHPAFHKAMAAPKASERFSVFSALSWPTCCPSSSTLCVPWASTVRPTGSRWSANLPTSLWCRNTLSLPSSRKHWDW